MLPSHLATEPPDPPPPTPTKTCSLVGPVALVVQALMAVLVIASLLVKRQYEGGPRHGSTSSIVVPRRKWKVWVFDVSKQLIGQTLIHASNLLISDQVAHGGGNNPCSLYFLNVLVDTTIGVLVLYLSLKGLTKACTMRWGDRGFTSGVYGHPPNIRFWAKQLGLYLAALLIMKIFVLVLFAFTLDTVLLPLAGWILNWMRTWSQVVFVMAVFPLFMNVIQFCLIDSLIKGREVGSDDDGGDSAGYHYTAAPSTVPKDIEEGVVDRSSSSFDHVREEDNHASSSEPSLPPLTERGRGKSRESSRASSSSRIRGGGGSRTPRSTTGSRTGSRKGRMTPIPGYSTSPRTNNPEHKSLRPVSGAMSRTRSSDGYGSTGSTEPSPAFRGLTLAVDPDVFSLGGQDPHAEMGKSATKAVMEEHEAMDPDFETTPRPDTGGTFASSSPPKSSSVASRRINDDVRIQARRSLSSEGRHVVSKGFHRRKRNDRYGKTTRGGGSDTDSGSVVLLNDV